MQILVHIINQDKELVAYNTLTILKILPKLPAYWKHTGRYGFSLILSLFYG